MWNGTLLARDHFEISLSCLCGVHHEAQQDNSILDSKDLRSAAMRCCAIAEFGNFQGRCRSRPYAPIRVAKLPEAYRARGHRKLVGHWHGCALLGGNPRMSSFFVERANAETLPISMERIDLCVNLVVVLSNYCRGGIEPNNRAAAK